MRCRIRVEVDTPGNGAMHALGRFISELMDTRGMSRPDLERASGLSRQHIHQLLDDRRTSLGRMLDDTTIAGLARAFADVGETAFITKAAESMGVPIDRLAPVDIDLDRLSDEALLGILARRLRRASAQPGPAGGEEQTPLAARRGRRAREQLDQEWNDREG
ncbi:MAG: helix-turn-helix domain-containing protein [Propionibacteriaceae bacterium]|nr:helix-turn-helix domain-containing protein [Propionibacteriaceae bacterium]